MSGKSFTSADACRIIRALPKAYETAGDGAEALLAEMRQVRDQLYRTEAVAVTLCLMNGMTLAGIAEHLGITRQATHKKWGELAREVQELRKQEDAVTDRASRIVSFERTQPTTASDEQHQDEQQLGAMLSS